MNSESVIAMGVRRESKKYHANSLYLDYRTFAHTYDVNTMSFDHRIPYIIADLQKKLALDTLIIGNWSIMPYEESTDYNKEFYTCEINHIYNFAYMYMGMGWLYVAAINLNNGKIFIYTSGGSNGYDVKNNFDKNIYNIKNNIMKKYLEISRFFYLIQECDNTHINEQKLKEIEKYIS